MELKPCPFCGSKAALEQDPHQVAWKVACDECGCSLGWEVSTNLAAATWNERAESHIERKV